MALGFIFILTMNVEALKIFAVIANPLLFLGHVFFYVGIKKFLNRKLNSWIPTIIFTLFNLSYYYFFFVTYSISGRTFVISSAIAVLSFMITYELFFKKDIAISHTANFSAIILFTYASFHTLRALKSITIPATDSYSDHSFVLISGFVVSVLFTNLFTFALIMMVNQRLHSDNTLEKEKLQFIFNTNIYAQLVTRLADGFVIDVNDEFCKLTGYTKDEIIGAFPQGDSLWLTIDDRNRYINALKDSGSCRNLEFTFARKDLSQFIGVISGKVFMIDSVEHILNAVRDITKSKEYEQALIESEEKYRSILNASPDDITITDLTGKIIMVSPAAKEMFGYPLDSEEFTGMHLLDFIIPADMDRAQANIRKMYTSGKRGTNEYQSVRRDGTVFHVEASSGFVYDANGKPDKMVFIIRDITPRKLIEAEIQELLTALELERNTAQLLSITDALTGLANRGHFDQTLRNEFSRLTRSTEPLSLIMLDIDFFKKFNDSYGHLAGDHCIQSISTLLQNTVGRGADLVARYGGEEFIVILPETDEYGAKTLGENIRKGVEDPAIPHISSTVSPFVTVSVGIITINPAEFESTDQILKLVDEALYSAKENGRNRCA